MRGILDTAPRSFGEVQRLQTYKDDARSGVWVAVWPAVGRAVVKQYRHLPLRQMLAALLLLHPAQREKRAARRLAARGVPVVPVMRLSWDWSGGGVRVWLVTPLWGKSLDRFLKANGAHGFATRKTVTLALARLVAKLHAAGLFFRDLKTSNLVVDPKGYAWLLDTGSIRRGRSRRKSVRMLGLLDATAVRDGASRAERLRFFRALVAMTPELGDARSLMDDVLKRSRAVQSRWR